MIAERIEATLRSLLLASTLLAGAAVLGSASYAPGVNAATTTTVSVTGSAPAAVSGPGTVTFSYTLLLPTAVTAVSFTTHQDALLPAIATGVKLDGVAVQASPIGAADVAVEASGLSAGEHVLTVQASVPGGSAASASSFLTFAYTDGSGPQTRSSAPLVVAINEPDLAVALTPGVGQSPGVIARLGTARVAAVAVDVSNVGAGAPAADLLLTFPAGLELAEPGVLRAGSAAAVPCAGVAGRPDQTLCAIGAVPGTGTPGSGPPGSGVSGSALSAPVSIVIAVRSTPHPPVNAVSALGIAVQPADRTAGVDLNPANNSAQLAFTFTGSARLSYALRASATTVRLGGVETVTLTVRNDGADPTQRTVGLLSLDKRRLRILAFSRGALSSTQSSAAVLAQQLSPGFAGLAPGASFVDAGLPQEAAGPAVGNGLAWDVGPLNAGQSASATLTVRAAVLAGTKLSFVAVSDAGDPDCRQLRCAAATAAVRVAPAVPDERIASQSSAGSVVARSPSSQAPSSSQASSARAPQVDAAARPGVQALASTGAAAFNGAGTGFGLIVFGLALLTAARRQGERAVSDR